MKQPCSRPFFFSFIWFHLLNDIVRLVVDGSSPSCIYVDVRASLADPSNRNLYLHKSRLRTEKYVRIPDTVNETVNKKNTREIEHAFSSTFGRCIHKIVQ
jgi:hypothetical protein